MINAVTFREFRGLDDLTIKPSQVTMLTGTNGVGKTSVLEGLFCLFSETRLDVSVLSRYNKSIGITVNQANNIPVGLAARQSYNYKLFWEECPSYNKKECSVEAHSDNSLAWKWKYRSAKFSDLTSEMTINYPFPIDASTEFALWEWKIKGDQTSDVTENASRAQILSPDGALYLMPNDMRISSVCRYLDFPTLRMQPQELPLSMAKKMTKALQIINPHVTDVRLKGVGSGLSVTLDDEREVSFGTIGNGAVTWASTLMAILDAADAVKQNSLDMPIILLIDEVGAGIHYSVMLDVWKYLRTFSEQNPKIQFVFTSHSDDCIQSYCRVFADSDAAKIIRLHRTAVGNRIASTDYLKDQFSGIAEGDWEVRG
jgi:ABC-type Na+ transport system ATPase subunit NatA